jgi:mono/diheme cytochrome c family protein
MRTSVLLASLGAIAATAAVIWPFIAPPDGRALYVEHCAGCHGRSLEGQPDWQQRLPDGRWPAPPHDATGHTWHHSDAILFEIVRNGPGSLLGPQYRTDMPAFVGILTDTEIRAVLAYLKSTWPADQRAYQELMNRPPAERLIQP